MEPLTDEQRRRILKRKVAANAFKKRKSRIKMQKLSRKANRSK